MNPSALSLTVDISITNFVNYCKETGISLFEYVYGVYQK